MIKEMSLEEIRDDLRYLIDECIDGIESLSLKIHVDLNNVRKRLHKIIKNHLMNSTIKERSKAHNDLTTFILVYFEFLKVIDTVLNRRSKELVNLSVNIEDDIIENEHNRFTLDPEFHFKIYCSLEETTKEAIVDSALNIVEMTRYISSFYSQLKSAKTDELDVRSNSILARTKVNLVMLLKIADEFDKCRLTNSKINQKAIFLKYTEGICDWTAPRNRLNELIKYTGLSKSIPDLTQDDMRFLWNSFLDKIRK